MAQQQNRDYCGRYAPGAGASSETQTVLTPASTAPQADGLATGTNEMARSWQNIARYNGTYVASTDSHQAPLAQIRAAGFAYSLEYGPDYGGTGPRRFEVRAHRSDQEAHQAQWDGHVIDIQFSNMSARVRAWLPTEWKAHQHTEQFQAFACAQQAQANGITTLVKASDDGYHTEAGLRTFSSDSDARQWLDETGWEESDLQEDCYTRDSDTLSAAWRVEVMHLRSPEQPAQPVSPDLVAKFQAGEQIHDEQYGTLALAGPATVTHDERTGRAEMAVPITYTPIRGIGPAGEDQEPVTQQATLQLFDSNQEGRYWLATVEGGVKQPYNGHATQLAERWLERTGINIGY